MKTQTVVERISRATGTPPYCRCGCGERVSSFQRTFVQGHHSRMPEYRERMKAGGNPTRGARHAFWKGDDAGAEAIHTWLRKYHPKTGICEECGAEGKTDYAFTKHPKRHTRDRADYRELCRPCHTSFDNRPKDASGRWAS